MEWQDIATAPMNGQTVWTASNAPTPNGPYLSRYRYGLRGEPQQDELAWRCDCCGRFYTPTHWLPLDALPPPPKG